MVAICVVIDVAICFLMAKLGDTIIGNTTVKAVEAVHTIDIRNVKEQILVTNDNSNVIVYIGIKGVFLIKDTNHSNICDVVRVITGIILRGRSRLGRIYINEN